MTVYKSPQYEALVFGLVVERLVDIGYPVAIKDFEYDPSFVVRYANIDFSPNTEILKM